MKDIIKEMRGLAPGYVGTRYVADWANRIESMQPAAGPWRTDVENAPIGVPLLNSKDGRVSCLKQFDGTDWRSIHGYKVTVPDAFAELNPYKETTP